MCLVACTSAPPSQPVAATAAAKPTTAPAAAPTTAPAAAPTSAQPAAAAQSSDTGPIKVGLLLTNAGVSGIFARYEERGARLYIDQVNKSGGINGRQIELVYYDTEGQPDRAASAFRRLANEDNVSAVIGPDSVLVLQGMSSVPREVGVLSVTATGSIDILPPTDRDWLVTAWAPIGWVNNTAAIYFKQKYGAKDLGMLVTADATGQAMIKLMQDFVPLAGMSVSQTAAQPATDRDLLPSFRTLLSAKPGAVQIVGSGPFANIALSQAEQAGLDVPIGYSGGNVVPELIKDMDPTATKNFHMVTVRLTAYDTLPASDPYVADLTKFANDYQAATGEPVSMPAGVGYDMARTVVDAIKTVGTDRTKIRDYVKTTQQLASVQGTKFQRNAGNMWGVDPTDMIVVGIQDGKFVFKDYIKPSYDALNITAQQITDVLRTSQVITN
jgi:branched-chain amino acid transport system substrate-binding protein